MGSPLAIKFTTITWTLLHVPYRCKQYELDFTKPKVWQFFETFYDETTHLIKDTSVRAPRLLKKGVLTGAKHTRNQLRQLKGQTDKLRQNLPKNRNRPRNGAKKISPLARFLVDIFMSVVDPLK